MNKYIQERITDRRPLTLNCVQKLVGQRSETNSSSEPWLWVSLDQVEVPLSSSVAAESPERGGGSVISYGLKL